MELAGAMYFHTLANSMFKTVKSKVEYMTVVGINPSEYIQLSRDS
jgi:hypothetical protein